MTQFRDEVEHRLPFLTFLVDEIERLDWILYGYCIRLYPRLDRDFIHLTYKGPSGSYARRWSLREIAWLLGARDELVELFDLPVLPPAGVAQIKERLSYITQDAARELIEKSLSVPR